MRLALASLRVVFATACEEGKVRLTPCAGIRIPRAQVDPEAEEEQTKALTEDELRALVAATTDCWKLYVRLVAETGLRVGGATALTWAHIDIGRMRVLVRRRVYGGKFEGPLYLRPDPSPGTQR